MALTIIKNLRLPLSRWSINKRSKFMPTLQPEFGTFKYSVEFIRQFKLRLNQQRYQSELYTKKINVFSVKNNDPDIFGTLTQDIVCDDECIDEGDKEEENYIQNPPKRDQQLQPRKYAKLIKEHLDQKRIKEAIDVLEIRMKEDRVKPDYYIYSLLISACGKAGYTKKAFQLFNKMKQRGIQVKPNIYTSLFNACANAPWLQDGLNKANHLREIMLEKFPNPNEKNYNAMIKAYGRCNDIKTAFMLADEMFDKNLDIKTDTLNFLLQACASDSEHGFRHALLIWHKMRGRGIEPDLYSFKNLLRCVRDCSIGDVNDIQEFITNIFSQYEEEKGQLELGKSNAALILPNEEKYVEIIPTSSKDCIIDETPNLICRNPHLGSLISISEIKTPEDRLLLLGGFSGILQEMKNLKITPCIQTFTLLLDVIPSTNVAEKSLLSMIRKIGLKSDIDFFNTLIKKRSMRFDYTGAKEVMSMINTAKLHPDIVTYGVLALGCQTQDDARELLNEMNKKEIRINIQILGAMLRQGCSKKNFPYIREIMHITMEQNVRPNEEYIQHLYKFEDQCKTFINKSRSAQSTYSFKKAFKKFQNDLDKFYEELGIKGMHLNDAIKKIREKPYQQFKESQPTGFENLKNMELRRKQKKMKYIKKIKINQLSDGIPEKEENQFTKKNETFITA